MFWSDKYSMPRAAPEENEWSMFSESLWKKLNTVLCCSSLSQHHTRFSQSVSWLGWSTSYIGRGGPIPPVSIDSVAHTLPLWYHFILSTMHGIAQDCKTLNRCLMGIYTHEAGTTNRELHRWVRSNICDLIKHWSLITWHMFIKGQGVSQSNTIVSNTYQFILLQITF